MREKRWKIARPVNYETTHWFRSRGQIVEKETRNQRKRSSSQKFSELLFKNLRRVVWMGRKFLTGIRGTGINGRMPAVDKFLIPFLLRRSSSPDFLRASARHFVRQYWKCLENGLICILPTRALHERKPVAYILSTIRSMREFWWWWCGGIFHWLPLTSPSSTALLLCGVVAVTHYVLPFKIWILPWPFGGRLK